MMMIEEERMGKKRRGKGRSRGMLSNRRKGEKRPGKEMGSVMSVVTIHAVLSTNI